MGKKFQKGNQAAKGYELPTVEFRQEQKLTRSKLEATLHKYMYKTSDELRALLKTPGDTPAYELMIVSILAKAMTGGDTHRAEFLLNRLMDKVPDQVVVEDRRKDEMAKAMAEDLLKAKDAIK